MEDTLFTISVACILPIVVVLIVFIASMNSDNKRAQVLIKAIEANKDADTTKLVEALGKPRKTPLEILNTRLLRGCIFTLVGLGLIIVGLVGLFNGVSYQEDPVAVPLVFGGASLAVGASYLIVYFITRKQVRA